MFNTFQHSGVLVVGQGFSRAAPPTILKADLEKSEDIKTLLEEVKYDPINENFNGGIVLIL